MRFEYELSKVAAKKLKVLYVGIHERSYVYQFSFPFTFIDISDKYLVRNSSKIKVQNCIQIQEEYELVILSGVHNYGTDSDGFNQILTKENFKRFLILDWKEHHSYHKKFFDKNSKEKFLKRSFFYYTTNRSEKET